MRAVGEKGVFGGEPAAGDALLLHPSGNLGFDGGGADDTRGAERYEHRAGGMRSDIGLKSDGAELVGFAAVGAESG